jgi:CRISPR-associated protein Cas2
MSYSELNNVEWEEPVDEYNRYNPGLTVSEYDPAKEVYKNMLHLVAYDVRDPKRLRKVARACEDFGVRVEYSVFECDLSEELFASLWERVFAEIDQEEDRIIAYKICGACVAKIKSIGATFRPEKPLLYIL